MGNWFHNISPFCGMCQLMKHFCLQCDIQQLHQPMRWSYYYYNFARDQMEGQRRQITWPKSQFLTCNPGAWSWPHPPHPHPITPAGLLLHMTQHQTPKSAPFKWLVHHRHRFPKTSEMLWLLLRLWACGLVSNHLYTASFTDTSREISELQRTIYMETELDSLYVLMTNY